MSWISIDQRLSEPGFLLEKAGDVPEVGSIIEFKRLRFTITRGTAQSIEAVR